MLEPRRSRFRVCVLVGLLVWALSGIGVMGLLLVLLSRVEESQGMRRALVVGMVGLGVLGLVCLILLVVPAVTRRIQRRRDEGAFRVGGQVWWQADLGIVIDSIDNETNQAAMLGLLLPPGTPEAEARRVAEVIGRRIADGQGTAFMATQDSVVAQGRGWPTSGCAVDHLGHRFAPMAPGRHLGVLPDGAVLGLRPGREQPIDVSGVVRAFDVDSASVPPSGQISYAAPSSLRVVAYVSCMVVLGVVSSFIHFSLRFSGVIPVWLQVLICGSAAAVLALVLVALGPLLGRTRIDQEGVHVIHLLRRRTLPWRRIRGFGVRLHKRGPGWSWNGWGHSRWFRHLVAVDDSGATMMLPGTVQVGVPRTRWLTEQLCLLDVMRRSRQ